MADTHELKKLRQKLAYGLTSFNSIVPDVIVVLFHAQENKD